MPAIQRYAHRTMLVEAACADSGAANELARSVVETQVAGVGTGGPEGPGAGLIGRETNAPGLAAVPKSIDLAGFTEGRGENHCERSVLEGMRIHETALERLLEPAPLADDRHLGRWGGGKKVVSKKEA